MKRPMQKVRGAILVMAALMLVVLIGIAAFALDLGRLYVLHTEMQNAVDAAVLSAAAELDGEAGAREDAKKAANQEMLNHLAHFSKQPELLENLDIEADPRIFTFYTWIGSSMDSLEPPFDCVPEGDKCLAIGDDDASYVQIRLDPTLLGDDDFRYQIDLIFLPALSLFGGIDTSPVSTQVVALAGAHANVVCEYPPMIICDPNEGTGVPLTPGQMVVLKAQGPSGSWVPGGFGWLLPTAENLPQDPEDDDVVGNLNKLFAHRLGSKYGQGCTPPIVELYPGNVENWARWGLNTRFGIYYKVDDPIVGGEKESGKRSAPNVVDYPRDDELLDESGTCNRDVDKKFGDCEDVDEGDNCSNWEESEPECIVSPSPPGVSEYNHPRQYSRERYDIDFHDVYGGGDVPDAHDSGDPDDPLGPLGDRLVQTRYQYYKWEHEHVLAEPRTGLDETEITPKARDCEEDDEGDNCRLLHGDPANYNINPNFVDEFDEDERRVLFVAAVACGTYGIKAGYGPINLNEVDAQWMRFFMTEHVSNPSEGVNIYAEFIEYVKQETNDEHFRKVIQLYE